MVTYLFKQLTIISKHIEPLQLNSLTQQYSEKSMTTKFYVVWVGRETGVFTNWPQTHKLINKFPQAKYKSFPSKEEADVAFAAGWGTASKHNGKTNTKTTITKKTANTNAKKTTTNNKYDVSVYCDGGCDPNPGEAGSGIAVYHQGNLSELWYGIYNPKGTNNTAELNALNQSLLIAKDVINSGKTVEILCDSQYAINCITNWAFGWKAKGWKRKTGDIKNLTLIQEAHELYVKISNDVVVSHVKAHSGIEGNELADRMTIFAVNQKDPNFCRYSEPFDLQNILDFRTG